MDQAFLRSTERPDYSDGSPTLRLVDLFCGCGGMSLGIAEAAKRSGAAVRVALAVDFDEMATGVYQNNFSGTTVRTVGVETLFDGELGAAVTSTEQALADEVAADGIDILVGGPPCQGHSDLNNTSRRKDKRNELYVRMARAAEVLRPSMVMIENVPAVQHAAQGVVATVVEHLQGLGYRVGHAVVDVSQLGVPQTRKRHIVLAIDDSIDVTAVDVLEGAIANPHSARTVDWAIRDLVDLPEQGRSGFDTPSRVSDTNKERMAWFFEDPENRYDLPNPRRPPCHRDKEHSYNSVYGRLRWDAPAQTITTGFTSMGQGRYVHPAKPRTLTPHEAARLQGFPDFFKFDVKTTAERTTWSKLIGNAVPPKLSMVVGLPVIEALVLRKREEQEPEEEQRVPLRQVAAIGSQARAK